jgi:hypothetical protein
MNLTRRKPRSKRHYRSTKLKKEVGSWPVSVIPGVGSFAASFFRGDLVMWPVGGYAWPMHDARTIATTFLERLDERRRR